MCKDLGPLIFSSTAVPTKEGLPDVLLDKVRKEKRRPHVHKDPLRDPTTDVVTLETEAVMYDKRDTQRQKDTAKGETCTETEKSKRIFLWSV